MHITAQGPRLHCVEWDVKLYHDVTVKAVLNKKSFEASLESFDRARRLLQF